MATTLSKFAVCSGNSIHAQSKDRGTVLPLVEKSQPKESRYLAQDARRKLQVAGLVYLQPGATMSR